MRARNQIDQSLRIIVAVEPPFSVDLIVRTPKRLSRDWQDGDWFLREIVAKGKVLYEKTDGSMGPKGGRRHPGRNEPEGQQTAPQ